MSSGLEFEVVSCCGLGREPDKPEAYGLASPGECVSFSRRRRTRSACWEIHCTVELTSNTLQSRVMSETDPAAPGGEQQAAARANRILPRIRMRRKSRTLIGGGISTWNTVLATILAIAGTVIAYEQWHLADVTNRASDQQAAATAKAADQESLVSLVGDIARLRSRCRKHRRNEVAAVHQEMAVDAEQGLALVNELGGHVPAIDNLELGVGFEPSGELRWALQSFNRAGTDTTDPFYRSKALRAAAAILYSLGGQPTRERCTPRHPPRIPHVDQRRDMPRSQFDQNHELVDLWATIWSADPIVRGRRSGRRAICSKQLSSSSKTHSQQTQPFARTFSMRPTRSARAESTRSTRLMCRCHKGARPFA